MAYRHIESIERMKRSDLKNKRIIILGDERYIRDFLYAFDDITPTLIVCNGSAEYQYQVNALKKENKCEVVIILCMYEEMDILADLRMFGYEKGRNLISAEECFKWLDFPIEDKSNNRDVFIWGTGDDGYWFFKNYLNYHAEIHIVGVIDSNQEKEGKIFFGKPIYQPQRVIEDASAFVIIASRRYYTEIRKILEQYGFKNKEDFVSFLEINSYASAMMRKTVYDIPKIDFLCEKPFSAFEIKPEGRTLICGGMHETYEKCIPMYYADFSDIWHSNLLKVVRLSCINGTYSFCDPVICNYIRESGVRTINTDDCKYEKEKTKQQIEYINKKRSNEINQIFDRDRYKRKELESPLTVQMGFDESCNLHCPSCRKSVYYAEANKLDELERFKDRIYAEVIDNVERIKIAGMGEAFAGKIYREMLFDSELAAKVRKLGIISNGSMFTPAIFDKLFEIWEEIRVMISMDGATKKTAEKLRKGINFDIWKHNMEYIGEMRKRGRIDNLAFNFVVQRENYLEMPDFVDLTLGYHADQIKFSVLGNWSGLSSKEFDEYSMFDENGEMKPELVDVVRDERFGRKEVHLFRWVDW